MHGFTSKTILPYNNNDLYTRDCLMCALLCYIFLAVEDLSALQGIILIKLCFEITCYFFGIKQKKTTYHGWFLLSIRPISSFLGGFEVFSAHEPWDACVQIRTLAMHVHSLEIFEHFVVVLCKAKLCNDQVDNQCFFNFIFYKDLLSGLHTYSRKVINHVGVRG